MDGGRDDRDASGVAPSVGRLGAALAADALSSALWGVVAALGDRHERVADGAPTSPRSLMPRLETVATDLLCAVLRRIDLSAVVDRLDVQRIVDRIDLTGALRRVDLDELAARVELGGPRAGAPTTRARSRSPTASRWSRSSPRSGRSPGRT